MAGVVEGAASGAAVQAFVTSLLDASLKVSHFKPRLNRLQATLLLIHCQNYSNPSILPHDAVAFTHLLSKGVRLVQKCSQVRWNVFKRLYYAYKLTQLEASLLRFFQIDMTALHYVETKNISLRMSDLEDKIDEMAAAVLKGSDVTNKLRSSHESTPHIMMGKGQTCVPVLGFIE